MAKFGEGDPRWIVEERPDAKNVNNWHWTEKNATNWSQDTLKRLLTGLEIECQQGRCLVTCVNRCDGEAIVNNRKGKLIFLYEWVIEAEWTYLGLSDKTIKGKLNVPNLSEENTISEVDAVFSLDEESPEGHTVKTFLLKNGVEKVRVRLDQYVKELKEEFSKGLILPKKEGGNADSKAGHDKASGQAKKNGKSSANQGKCATVPGFKISSKRIENSMKFQCTAEELYNAITKPELMTAFSGSPAKSVLKKGGEFELFGGNIHGYYEELIPHEKLKMKWRQKRWPSEHYSIVTLAFNQQSDHTSLNLTQTDIPEVDIDAATENWNRYYFDAIKRVFGYGSFITV